jgi:hypothetical protein
MLGAAENDRRVRPAAIEQGAQDTQLRLRLDLVDQVFDLGRGGCLCVLPPDNFSFTPALRLRRPGRGAHFRPGAGIGHA